MEGEKTLQAHKGGGQQPHAALTAPVLPMQPDPRPRIICQKLGASTQSAAEIMHQSPPTKLGRKMEQGNSDPWGRNIMIKRSPYIAMRQDEQRSNVESSKH